MCCDLQDAALQSAAMEFHERLRLARRRRFSEAKEAADFMGVPQGTYANHEAGSRQPDLARIKRYAAAFGVPVAWLAYGEGSEPAELPAVDNEVSVTTLPNRMARVAGPVEAGRFREAEDFAFSGSEGEFISVEPDPDFPHARQVAFRVAGNSMNKARPIPILDGALLVCVDWEDAEAAGLIITDDLIVVVEQIRDGGQLREWSVKRMHYLDDRTEFRPESDDPSHKAIIVHRDAEADDGRQVRVLALVTKIFNRLPIRLAIRKRR